MRAHRVRLGCDASCTSRRYSGTMPPAPPLWSRKWLRTSRSARSSGSTTGSRRGHYRSYPDTTGRWRDAGVDQSLGEPHRRILTRFNRWTQHLNDGGAFDGTTTGLGGSIDGTGGDAVAGSAACPTGSRTRVLGADRAWAHERGRGGRVRRVESGGITVVPTRWRDAADRACPGVGEISVLLRTGRHRGPAGGGNQHATDRDPDRKVTVDDISGTASQRRHPQREARLPGIDGAMEGRSRRTTTQSSETR